MSFYSCEYKFDLNDEIEVKKEENKELYIIDLKLEPIEIFGRGLLLTYKNKYYVLTCEHCILTNSNNLKYLKLDISNYNNVEVKLKLYLPEIDICLFEIISQINIDKDIYYYKLEYVLENELLNLGCFFVNNNEKINVENLSYYYGMNNSFRFPDIKLIEIELEYEYEELSLKGISGSGLYNENNEILGIILSITESGIINCICFRFLSYLLKGMLDNNKDNIDLIIINNKLIKKKSCNYLKVISNTLNYNSSTNSELSLKKKNYIYKINDQIINEEGLFYDKILKEYLPLNTYLLITLCYNMKIEIYYNRFYKKSIKDDKIIFDEGRSFDKTFKLNIKDNLRRLRWKNIIFFELSEETLKELVTNNLIKLNENNFNIFYDFSTNNNKIILVCDILNISEENQFEELMYNKLEKVGRSKVKNLEKLYDLLKKYKRNDAYFKFKNLNNLRIKELLI